VSYGTGSTFRLPRFFGLGSQKTFYGLLSNSLSNTLKVHCRVSSNLGEMSFKVFPNSSYRDFRSSLINR